MTALFAAASPGHGVDLEMWSGLVSVIFYGGLIYFAAPPIRKALKLRQRGTLAELARADLAQREIAKLKVRHEAAVVSVAAEARTMVAEGQRDAEALRNSLVAQAREEIARMQARGERETQQATYAATADIHRAGAEKAVAVARQSLRNSIGKADHEALVDQALGQLEQRFRGAT